jgi:DNA-binding transcriptional regulator YdaS (Cro superfamily)
MQLKLALLVFLVLGCVPIMKLNLYAQLAIEKAGGRGAVAEMFGITAEAVRQWTLADRRIPAEYILRLEEASGVSRYNLRPDVYGAQPELTP